MHYKIITGDGVIIKIISLKNCLLKKQNIDIAF